MPTYKPYTEVATLEANSQGDRTILEAHLDQNHAVIVDVIERLTMAVFEEGGVVVPGTVTNPSAAQVRVQGRMGVSKDGKTLLAVGDATVDLASVSTGTKCLVVIRALAGATAQHNFTDATTGEALSHTLTSAWGALAVLEGDTSDYPALPDDCVPVAKVTKTGASSISLDSVITTEPTLRFPGGGGGGGGNAYYDLQLGFPGVPDAAAIDLVLVPRAVTISDADPGEVYVGVNPTDGTATIDVQVNGVSVGGVDISTAGAVTWNLGANVELGAGDVLSLVAPSPADSTLANVIVAFKGEAS